MMSRSNEAFWWSLFSAGGVMAALFVPGLILSTGFLLPLSGDPEKNYRHLQSVLSGGWWQWPLRAVLFGVILLSFFHCAHRIRHTLMDLGLRRFELLLKAVCYTAALGGSIVAGLLLVSL